ncbi:butyrate kinase [Romboutsia hominis]|uniref:butyrate kinase n=1 Tax=Romboutsia hominis TaxID=1507512 RepID=UPI001F0528FF|nr:butyrate kinase [Romboutsia hominis]MCH1959544.1 butyrate kinase [Romboutsia hominis]MCH1970034.1 butyrate kinase [Romboutsia hominis]
MNYRILAINPGSTSTKIAVYDNEEQLLVKGIDHKAEEIANYERIQDQFEMRKQEVLKVLAENNIDINTLSAVVGRGGLLPPVKSGAYLVNDEMIDRLVNRPVIEHASNLGAIISYEIAKSIGVNAYIYDSVAVDEFNDIARLSGIKNMDRESLSHALNSRAMAIKFAKDNNKKYNELNIIVAHLGGGITVSVHEKGKMIDIVSDDEGPFSPERSGRVPCKKLINTCFSGNYTHKEMLKMIRGKGGIVSYLDTVDVREVEKMMEEGNKEAKLVHDAMCYQISKAIGELATVVEGKVDSIILTGGIAYSKLVTKHIKRRVEFISNVEIMPGENELDSLALGTLRVLNNEETAREYKEEILANA